MPQENELPKARMNQPVPPPRPGVKKRLARVALLVLAFYLVLCVILACLQRQMIYHPPVFSAAMADQMGRKALLERWINAAGANIGWKRLSPVQPAQGRVLILYGNASFAIGCDRYADALQSLGAFDVFILEYPGYGDRAGSPSQSSLFRAADEALPLAAANGPVYLLGESLGTGVAAYLAGTQPGRVAGLMLLSAYNRLADVAQYHLPGFPARWLLVERFPSEDYLKHFHGPVGVMVDGLDNVVPEKFGLRLYLGYAGQKRLWEFPRGNHVEIVEPPEQFWREVLDFWRTARPAQ